MKKEKILIPTTFGTGAEMIFNSQKYGKPMDLEHYLRSLKSLLKE